MYLGSIGLLKPLKQRFHFEKTFREKGVIINYHIEQ